MAKRSQIKAHGLARFMLYVLGHRPDEFGLVPDVEGFVTHKELLWVCHEEPGWRYVQKGHINEVLLSNDRNLFHTQEDKIRALDRRWHLDLENPAQGLPTTLFFGVRRRAHSAVMEKGLKGTQRKHVVLSPNQDMATRIGRRRDQKPVLLEISTHSISQAGIVLYPFGNLFLSDHVPAEAVNGPPVPKKDMEPARKKERKVPDKSLDSEMGTFVLDASRDPDPFRRSKGKKRRGWKENARRIRRGKGN